MQVCPFRRILMPSMQKKWILGFCIYIIIKLVNNSNKKIFNPSLQTDAQTTPSTVRNGPTC